MRGEPGQADELQPDREEDLCALVQRLSPGIKRDLKGGAATAAPASQRPVSNYESHKKGGNVPSFPRDEVTDRNMLALLSPAAGRVCDGLESPGRSEADGGAERARSPAGDPGEGGEGRSGCVGEGLRRSPGGQAGGIGCAAAQGCPSNGEDRGPTGSSPAPTGELGADRPRTAAHLAHGRRNSEDGADEPGGASTDGRARPPSSPKLQDFKCNICGYGYYGNDPTDLLKHFRKYHLGLHNRTRQDAELDTKILALHNMVQFSGQAHAKDAGRLLQHSILTGALPEAGSPRPMLLNGTYDVQVPPLSVPQLVTCASAPTRQPPRHPHVLQITAPQCPLLMGRVLLLVLVIWGRFSTLLMSTPGRQQLDHIRPWHLNSSIKTSSINGPHLPASRLSDIGSVGSMYRCFLRVHGHRSAVIRCPRLPDACPAPQCPSHAPQPPDPGSRALGPHLLIAYGCVIPHVFSVCSGHCLALVTGLVFSFSNFFYFLVNRRVHGCCKCRHCSFTAGDTAALLEHFNAAHCQDPRDPSPSPSNGCPPPSSASVKEESKGDLKVYSLVPPDARSAEVGAGPEGVKREMPDEKEALREKGWGESAGGGGEPTRGLLWVPKERTADILRASPSQYSQGTLSLLNPVSQEQHQQTTTVLRDSPGLVFGLGADAKGFLPGAHASGVEKVGQLPPQYSTDSKASKEEPSSLLRVRRLGVHSSSPHLLSRFVSSPPPPPKELRTPRPLNIIKQNNGEQIIRRRTRKRLNPDSMPVEPVSSKQQRVGAEEQVNGSPLERRPDEAGPDPPAASRGEHQPALTKADVYSSLGTKGHPSPRSTHAFLVSQTLEIHKRMPPLHKSPQDSGPEGNGIGAGIPVAAEGKSSSERGSPIEKYMRPAKQASYSPPGSPIEKYQYPFFSLPFLHSDLQSEADWLRFWTKYKMSVPGNPPYLNVPSLANPCQSFVPYPPFGVAPHFPAPGPDNDIPLDLAVRHSKPVPANGASDEASCAEPAAKRGGPPPEKVERGTQDEQSSKCAHCSVVFLDEVMYALHMSCHGDGGPFQCSICLHACADKYDFTTHIQRGLHRPAGEVRADASPKE
uniref:Trichorhinophalangeal syndrome I n=1 Tax=Paramormyrops kingsleyae TaxID=1676925 RepID=A0A3B3R0P8_9TELE